MRWHTQDWRMPIPCFPTLAVTPVTSFPRSNAAAEKALELDPTLARPHAVLGANHMQIDWDFSGGEAESRKALELDPSDATAHQWYAESLAFIGGRAEESIAEANRAHQLDPLSPIIESATQTVNLIRRLRWSRRSRLTIRRLASRTSAWHLHIGASISIQRAFKNLESPLTC
jgi:tetratricopeptide (TPR) repeat protein